MVNINIFENTPVGKAVLSMALPMIISQTITIIYNVADTFFIGQLNDPTQVAAVTLALPLFSCMRAISNLFGVGGAAMVSRILGSGNEKRAKEYSSFCIWSAVVVAFLFGLIIFFTRPILLPRLGTTPDTFAYTCEYLFWTITIGAVPTVLNSTFANLIRAEGYSKQAGLGVALGGILNILLDFIFIFGFKLEIKGAAIATLLASIITTLYFVTFIRIKQPNLVLTLNPRCYSWKILTTKNTLMAGFPNFIISFMAVFSNATMNFIMSTYSTEAIAGLGIAKRIDMLIVAIAQGMTIGVLPLLSYNYAAGNIKRFNKIVKTTLCFGITLSLIGMILLFTIATPLSQAFIDDVRTVGYSQDFIRIISFTSLTSINILMTISVFQATHREFKSIVISFLRKGMLDIPLMIILNHLFGIYGVVWAMPLTDFILVSIALPVLILHLKTIKSSQ